MEDAERLPLPTMSLFAKPNVDKYSLLSKGREVVREKKNASRKTKTNLPDDMERLKEAMEQAKNEKMENSYVWLGKSGRELVLICVRLVRKSSVLSWLPPVRNVVRQKEARTSSCRPRQPQG